MGLTGAVALITGGGTGLVTRDAPLRRPASPDESAAICHFLSSDQASIVTGVVLPADSTSTIVDVPTLALGE